MIFGQGYVHVNVGRGGAEEEVKEGGEEEGEERGDCAASKLVHSPINILENVIRLKLVKLLAQGSQQIGTHIHT